MAAAKLQRLRFLFGDKDLPQQPNSTCERTIDAELGGLHSSLAHLTLKEPEEPSNNSLSSLSQDNTVTPCLDTDSQFNSVIKEVRQESLSKDQNKNGNELPDSRLTQTQVASQDADSPSDALSSTELPPCQAIISPVHNEIPDKAASKSRRLQLLFGNLDLPEKPNSTQERTIDQELEDFYSSQAQNTLSPIEAHPQQVNVAMVREVVQADPYDSLEDGSDMDDPFIAACARKEAKRLSESQNKSKKKNKNKNQGTKVETQKQSHNMDLRATDAPASLSKPKLSEGATKLGTFCPISSVAKFPYKYIDKDHSEAVADAFFNAGKFWNRTFDVYYIHPPSDIATKPILLMPVSQVEKLISDIARAFHCKLGLPPYAEESGFSLSFFDDGTPQPRYLGTSTSRGHFQEMELHVPPSMAVDFGPPRQGIADVNRSWEAFREKMQLAVDASKKKSKAIKDKKRQTRITTHLDWFRQLKRTQRYLGLRAHVLDLPEPVMEGTWEEQQQKYEEHMIATNQKLLPLDVFKAVPYPFDQGAVFVCIDVEANEHVHEQITEIGISTLDTLDLVDVPPGEGGKNWMKKIRSRHFRTVEHSHVVNKTYIHGCADKFEFGTSEWISVRNAAKAIDSCFKYPYSAGFVLDPSKATYLDAQYQDEESAAVNASTTTLHDTIAVQDQTNAAETGSQGDLQATNTDEVVIDKDEVASSSGSAPDPMVTDASSTTTIEHVDPSSTKAGNGDVVMKDKPAAKVAIPSLDLAALIAARKSVAHRAKEDPSILEDPSLIPDHLKAHGKVVAPPTETNIDQFLKPNPPSSTTAFKPNNEHAQSQLTRPLILLGHDTKSDLGYLRLLGYDPASYNSTLLEALDTAAMYKVLKRESNAPKLGNILVDLGLTGWHLHNAGNDARYTMEAMIGIAIKARKVEDNGGKDPDEAWLQHVQEEGQDKMNEMERRIQRETEEARLRVIEEYDTWASVPGLAPLVPNPAQNQRMPDLNQYTEASPPASHFIEEHQSSPLSPPRKFTFPTDVFPSDAIDGGEAIPLTPSKKSMNTAANVSATQAANVSAYFNGGAKKFAPGTVDKEAVEAELSRQVEFDWDGDGLKINGRPPVESEFARVVRERKEMKAAMDMQENGAGVPIQVDGGGDEEVPEGAPVPGKEGKGKGKGVDGAGKPSHGW